MGGFLMIFYVSINEITAELVRSIYGDNLNRDITIVCGNKTVMIKAVSNLTNFLFDLFCSHGRSPCWIIFSRILYNSFEKKVS